MKWDTKNFMPTGLLLCMEDCRCRCLLSNGRPVYASENKDALPRVPGIHAMLVYDLVNARISLRSRLRETMG